MYEGQKVICWDLDETLGSFTIIAYELDGFAAPDSIGPISLRPGIITLLSELTGKRYLHFITLPDPKPRT